MTDPLQGAKRDAKTVLAKWRPSRDEDFCGPRVVWADAACELYDALAVSQAQVEEARDNLAWLWGATKHVGWVEEESDAALADDLRAYLQKYRPDVLLPSLGRAAICSCRATPNGLIHTPGCFQHPDALAAAGGTR